VLQSGTITDIRFVATKKMLNYDIGLFICVQECNGGKNGNQAWVNRFIYHNLHHHQGGFFVKGASDKVNGEKKLPDTDYHIVARDRQTNEYKILATTERKTPADLDRSLVRKSEKHDGHTTFEVQCYVHYNNGVQFKFFLLEGDEMDIVDNCQVLERIPERACEDIKTFRTSLSAGRYYFNMTGNHKITVIQTRGKEMTILFPFDIMQRFKNHPEYELAGLVQNAPTPQQVKANATNAMKSAALNQYLDFKKYEGSEGAMAKMKIVYPDFICPKFAYYEDFENKHLDHLRCTDIDDPMHQPKFYSGQPDDFPRVLRNSVIGSASARSPAVAVINYHQCKPAARSSSTAVSISHQRKSAPRRNFHNASGPSVAAAAAQESSRKRSSYSSQQPIHQSQHHSRNQCRRTITNNVNKLDSSNKSWACSQCTFDNVSPLFLICEMCNSPRSVMIDLT
jgi:hypothetical protein